MKSVQISYDLFVALEEYHLAYDDDYAEEIHRVLEQKLDAMVRHELYAKYKTAPTAEEREQARQESAQPFMRQERSFTQSGWTKSTLRADRS